jgi:hypothetical protein
VLDEAGLTTSGLGLQADQRSTLGELARLRPGFLLPSRGSCYIGSGSSEAASRRQHSKPMADHSAHRTKRPEAEQKDRASTLPDTIAMCSWRVAR